MSYIAIEIIFFMWLHLYLIYWCCKGNIDAAKINLKKGQGGFKKWGTFHLTQHLLAHLIHEKNGHTEEHNERRGGWLWTEAKKKGTRREEEKIINTQTSRCSTQMWFARSMSGTALTGKPITPILPRNNTCQWTFLKAFVYSACEDLLKRSNHIGKTGKTATLYVLPCDSFLLFYVIPTDCFDVMSFRINERSLRLDWTLCKSRAGWLWFSAKWHLSFVF